MTAGKAVALFVAWFALTVALFGVGVMVVTSDAPLMVYSLFENEPHHAIGRINDATLLIFAGVLPVVIVAWKRERIYALLGGDLTNIGRALVLLTAWVALAIVATLISLVPLLIMAAALQLLFEMFGSANNPYLYWIENSSPYLILDVITLMLPLVLVVWNRRLIYDLLRVDSWFGAKSE